MILLHRLPWNLLPWLLLIRVAGLNIQDSATVVNHKVMQGSELPKENQSVGKHVTTLTLSVRCKGKPPDAVCKLHILGHGKKDC